MSQVDLSELAIDRSNASPESLRLRRNVLTRYVLPALLILGFLALVLWASRDFLLPPTPVKVVPVMATQAEIRSEGTSLFNAAGWIEPRPTAIRVAALAEGVVEELLVVEDQAVDAGQPVAELVKDDAKLGYQRAIADRQLAEAELERAEAVLEAAETRFNQPVHLEAMLADADAELAKLNTMLKNLPFETKRAVSQLSFAKRDYKRNISAGNSVSTREIDEAKTDFETAEALLNELKNRDASLVAEKTAISQRREALNVQLQLLADETEAKDRAEAQVKAATARVQQMTVAEEESELRLRRMTIRAPVAGRIFQLIGLPGARVGGGVMTAMQGHDGGTVVTMYQPQSLQIRVDVRFEDIPKVSLGQSVRIDNPALKNPIVGSVLFISSEADIQKNTLQIKVAIDDPPSFFKPHMLLDVTFLAPKQTQQNAAAKEELRFYIPSQYISQFEGQDVVWIADQSEGRARRVNVVTGIKGSEGMVEIESGLNIGSRIITSGWDRLNDGERIVVTEDN
jgi:RND family efflux transporter MFP subunit